MADFEEIREEDEDEYEETEKPDQLAAVEVIDADTEEGAPLEQEFFDALAKEYELVSQELESERKLGKFQAEYVKLHDVMLKCYTNEKRLYQKCSELQEEITTRDAMLKASDEDQDNMTKMLKMELEKFRKWLDASRKKEEQQRDQIELLKLEMTSLQKMMDEGFGGLGTDMSIDDILNEKEELENERNVLKEQVFKYKEELEALEEEYERTVHERNMTQQQYNELQEQLDAHVLEFERETRRKEKAEMGLSNAKQIIVVKEAEIQEMENQNKKLKDEIQKHEINAKNQKTLLEQATKEEELINSRLHKLKMEYDSLAHHSREQNEKNSLLITQLKLKEEDIRHLKQEIVHVAKLRETVVRRLRYVESEKADVLSECNAFQAQVLSLEKDRDDLQKKVDSHKKERDMLIKERDNLAKNLERIETVGQKYLDMIRIHEQSKKNLEYEIRTYKADGLKQSKLILMLEKDKNHYVTECSDLRTKGVQLMEELKIKELQVFDLKKKIAESETRLKQQQSLYEAVRSDRNLYSRNLIEAQDEIMELKRKMKIMNHQVEQLKEEINMKVQALAKQHADHTRLEKDKDMLLHELQEVKQQATELRTHIKGKEEEHKKLLKIITEGDQEKGRLNRQLDQLLNDRDILGSQLVRRNDELALLYEKIKIQQSTLLKGETQYKQRLEDIRLLKLEIRKLHYDKSTLTKSITNIQELRSEMRRMQQELLQSKARCKALEEELETPLNIHRWRKLEGTDPSTFELIQKVQTLQRRLIAKTGEVVNKELEIKEKEKLYIELKQILSHLPGPDMAIQLHTYQKIVRDRTKDLKVLTAELNMMETIANTLKDDLSKVNLELQNVKKKYFDLKRKAYLSSQAKDSSTTMTSQSTQDTVSLTTMPLLNTNPKNSNKFFGAGFKVAA